MSIGVNWGDIPDRRPGGGTVTTLCLCAHPQGSRPEPSDWYRRQVLARDRGICHVCHWPAADAIDHIDGDHDNNAPSNLAPIHDIPCRQLKAARP